MLPREQVELAAWACIHARPMIEKSPTLSSEAVSEYWIASRCRMDHWGRALRRLGDSRSIPHTAVRESILQLIDEILLSQVLTRSVAAITHAHDVRHDLDESRSIGRNTLQAHRDIRKRLVVLLKAWWPSDSESWGEATQKMRSVDRWSDMLIAQIGDPKLFGGIACDIDRLTDFAYDTFPGRASTAVLALTIESIRRSFATGAQEALHPELNRRIGGAALGLFGSEAFDSLGLATPVWASRFERRSEEAIAMIDRLYNDDFQKSSPPTKRWRWASES